MEKLNVSRGSADGGGHRRSRWSRFYRFFSCVGVGGEAAGSIDHADAPTTPPVNAADLQPSAACDDFLYIDEPELPALPTSACDTSAFGCSVDTAPVQPELRVPTTPTVDAEDGIRSEPNLAASCESFDMFVADYVERCRSIKRRDPSFPDVFARVPGCRPTMLFESHAAHLRKLAPWMELSYEVEAPEYNVGEFGNVDVTCRPEESSDEVYNGHEPCLFLSLYIRVMVIVWR